MDAPTTCSAPWALAALNVDSSEKANPNVEGKDIGTMVEQDRYQGKEKPPRKSNLSFSDQNQPPKLPRAGHSEVGPFTESFVLCRRVALELM